MSLVATMPETDTASETPSVLPGTPVVFTEPMLGFERLQKFRLERIRGTPFSWLHSEDDRTAHFCLLAIFEAGLDPDIEISTSDAASIGAHDTSDITVLGVVVLDQDPAKIRVNLRAPVIYCPSTGKAKQVVLSNPALPVQYLLKDVSAARAARAN